MEGMRTKELLPRSTNILNLVFSCEKKMAYYRNALTGVGFVGNNDIDIKEFKI